MTPCISQVTTLPGSFADDAADYPAGGCRALEVWLTKLEQHLEAVSAEDTLLALADRGLKLVAAGYQGGLLLSQGEQRKAHFEHFKRRLALCERFTIPTLLLVADFARAPEASDLARAVVSLAQAAQWAAGFGVRIALEFRGADAFCASLDTAVTLVEQCGEPNAGICLDVFHFYKGSSKTEDLERLTPANLFHVQVCDVAGVPRELMTDSDRVMPGDGDFRLQPVIQRLNEIGYAGAVSLELMNPILWSLKATQVTELGMAALSRLLT
ncbi:sugar phosphate isomerase/epimerase family protein [Gemmata sp. JC717]|uniref:sugar phosphate isomerase/epimerase family protein n=1 Tax=Gemmata algarum TaxID=2975278 RepID=UPI0021BB24E5|nr:sugar phosphate isomerase/epimerase family protein [Gemmata algarum]MDY3553709.1 sugar phosphate isomerase/epimerase family protein [Gemmata algarum]